VGSKYTRGWLEELIAIPYIPYLDLVSQFGVRERQGKKNERRETKRKERDGGKHPSQS